MYIWVWKKIDNVTMKVIEEKFCVTALKNLVDEKEIESIKLVLKYSNI